MIPPVSREVLPDHVVEKSEEARPLDRARQLTLLLGRDRGDAARNDLAALGDVTLQELHVLVVDLRRVGAGERAGLAAAEERTAGRKLGEAHVIPPSSRSLPTLRAGHVLRARAGARHGAPRGRARGPPCASSPM